MEEKTVTFSGFPKPLLAAFRYLRGEYSDYFLKLAKPIKVEAKEGNYNLSVFRPSQASSDSLGNLEKVLGKNINKIFSKERMPIRKDPIDLLQPHQKYFHTNEISLRFFKDHTPYKVTLKKKRKEAVIEIKVDRG